MKVRVISGIIGLVILFTVVLVGGQVLNISTLLISFIGLYEFDRAVRKINGLKPILVINYLFTICLYTLLMINKNNLFTLILFIYIMSLLCLLVFDEKVKISDIAVTALGALYIPFSISHIALLGGSIYIWLVFITAWGTDTFAYFVGVNFGKRKLCPNLSPNKSIEGSFGGILGSLCLALIFSFYFKLDNVFGIAVLSIICSVMAQIGDLTASRIKRLANIKDYGKIMPGHGGILDRFDSILFTGPLVYYYIALFVL
ncbi:phosphatidate cytidylyltransferase [Proteiniborus sp. MB09-C3]|uniref:phosphatidate cytidylyltransferase n=1 Tax=Proteiniborus sp. MB09-C3 TaxID=3050072 RepID=UPI00255626AA|nr:phosphatidate cytidylyltransferase [Proteiniborus sp. MB09-C3]WIV10892.1 phosphatidate cytidylyltransferase [Proteiniborus sp. MB09-C3]